MLMFPKGLEKLLDFSNSSWENVTGLPNFLMTYDLHSGGGSLMRPDEVHSEAPRCHCRSLPGFLLCLFSDCFAPPSVKRFAPLQITPF